MLSWREQITVRLDEMISVLNQTNV